MTRPNTSRRDFLKQSTALGAAFWVSGQAPNLYAQSDSPNEKLNIGVIGCGGKGESDTAHCASENVVALCDVDENRAAKSFENFPKAKRYQDFRRMLENEKLDAVVISTPDHTHAVAAAMAMKMGKHVYCQKPLTYSVYEARLLRETAAAQKVATQMGNQGTALDGFRRAVEVIQSGALGPVREVHVWTNRPIWPQGIGRPQETHEIPAHLNWDLWLGPAPERPYNKAYAPFNWRGWVDFGTGALGDMACHTANMAFMALKLGYPVAIEAESSGVNGETWPTWSTIRFDFPERGDQPALKFYWYDGKKDGQPNLPSPEIVKGRKLTGSGSVLVGDKGILYSPNDYGASYELLPAEVFADFKDPPQTLPRLPGGNNDLNQKLEWIAACKGGPAPLANFDYAGLLTETILLGNVALRVGKRIEWDGPNMKATNAPEAENYIHREYCKGWTL